MIRISPHPNERTNERPSESTKRTYPLNPIQTRRSLRYHTRRFPSPIVARVLRQSRLVAQSPRVARTVPRPFSPRALSPHECTFLNRSTAYAFPKVTIVSPITRSIVVVVVVFVARAPTVRVDVVVAFFPPPPRARRNLTRERTRTRARTRRTSASSPSRSRRARATLSSSIRRLGRSVADSGRGPWHKTTSHDSSGGLSVAPWVQRIRGETVRGDFRAIRRPLRVNLGVDV